MKFTPEPRYKKGDKVVVRWYGEMEDTIEEILSPYLIAEKYWYYYFVGKPTSFNKDEDSIRLLTKWYEMKHKKVEQKKYIVVKTSCNNVEVDQLKTRAEILNCNVSEDRYIIDVTTGIKYTIDKTLKVIK